MIAGSDLTASAPGSIRPPADATGRRGRSLAVRLRGSVARLVFLALVITAIWLFVRARRGVHGIRTLRDAYAKGEVNEAEYRERLAVLRETRR